MKKQGDTYFKIISVVLAVLMVSYVLLSVVFRRGSSYTTQPAALCEVGDGLTVSGFVVRSETVLTSGERLTVCELTEGEWIGGGQTVATAYRDAGARLLRQELASLQAQLKQLRFAADGSNPSGLDADIRTLLLRLSAQTARRDYEAVQSAATELQPMILRRGVSDGDAAELQRRIEELEARIAALQADVRDGAAEVPAPDSGYYSAQPDGFETLLTPESVLSISPSTLNSLTADAVSDYAIGRLCTGQTWYFMAVIPAERAQQCRERSYLTVSLSGQGLRELRMRIERVGDAEDGKCVLVLSYEKKLQEVTALRRQNADIVFRSYEGLRVPKSALYYIDGAAGVYVLQNTLARWKTVEILYESGDDYIVRWDDGSTSNLWPQDELILTNQTIENGMVMR